MAPLAANPLQFRPCFGFHCLQLAFFLSLFLSDVCKMTFLGNKSIWITSETPTNKQLKFGTIARLSSRVENPTLTMVHGYSIS